MNTNKLLGKLRKATKTKQRSPNLIGDIHLQADDIAAIAKHLDETNSEEVICSLAAWANRGPYGEFLTVQLSPPYERRDQQSQPANNLDFVFGDQEERQLEAVSPGRPTLCVTFRLPKELLARVDVICRELDLRRSQLLRRSVTEYLARNDAGPNGTS